MKMSMIVMFMMLQGVAIAGVWTPAKVISEIREYGNGLQVYGQDLSSSAIPCANKTGAMPISSATPEQINRFNSIILAAYFANRPVILKISDTECSAEYPVYYAVRMK